MSVKPPMMKEVSAARASERAIVRVATVFLLVLIVLFAIVTSYERGGAITYAGADYMNNVVKPVIGIGTPCVCVRSRFFSRSITVDLGSTYAFFFSNQIPKSTNINNYF
jgi:hypothetical protein